MKSDFIKPIRNAKAVVKRFVVFDTETGEAPSKVHENINDITLRYIYAKLHRSQPMTYTDYKGVFTSEFDASPAKQRRSFTEWLISLAINNSSGRGIEAWAHNASYDVRGGIDYDYLKSQGWVFSFQSAHPFIFKAMNGHKELKILDTYSFYKYSLETLAPHVAMKKVVIDFDRLSSLPYAKQKELLTTRCKADVEITEEITSRLYDKMFGRVSVSAPQLAFNTFRMELGNPIERCHLLGYTEGHPELQDPNAYHGGRTEIFRRGEYPDSVRLDVNSMYPWAMCQPLPVSMGDHHISSTSGEGFDAIKSAVESKKYVATLRVVVNVPKTEFVGPFPFWDSKAKRLIFPTGRFETVINSPELDVMNNWRFVEEIKEAQMYRAFPFLKSYTEKYYRAKLLAEKRNDFIERAYNKVMMLNSIYGKFGQREKKTEDLPDELYEPLLGELDIPIPITGDARDILFDNGLTKLVTIDSDRDYEEYDIEKDEHINVTIINGLATYTRELDYNISPAVAAFICSYARARLYEFTQSKARDDLLYVDTDCLVIPRRYIGRFEDVIGDEMGMLKDEIHGDWIGFAPKVYLWLKDGDAPCKICKEVHFVGGRSIIEAKVKGIPHREFIQTITQVLQSKSIEDLVRHGEDTKVVFNHVLGFHESLRRYETVQLLSGSMMRRISLSDSKRQWSKDGRNSMPPSLTLGV